jgi:catechol 2,3-dioxygenase-like lactoylglutathione lyase family enzyme
MFENVPAFSGFSVDDIPAARKFYGDTLGIPVAEENGMLSLNISDTHFILIYPKVDHVPAEYTILNFPVDDIDAAVGQLSQKGIQMERFEGIDTDDKGISRDGPMIAWFKDPAGNVLSVVQGD